MSDVTAVDNYQSRTSGLVKPFNSEGEFNSVELQAAKTVHDHFVNTPGYIGTAYYGSTIGGYSSIDSDVDVKILSDPDANLATERNVISYIASLRETEKVLSKKTGRKIQIHEALVPIKALLSDMASESEEAVTGAGSLIGELSRLVVGEKIKEYRKIVGNKLRSLDAVRRQELVSKAVESLVRKESYSAHKVIRRKGVNWDSHQQERAVLWRNRINSLFGLI